MKDPHSDWFETCIAQLTASGTQRVWSVLVSIFGDLAQKETDQISGALITRLTGLAGIKSEATRVALRRLRKEGWIESTRSGRNSTHSLTAFGRAQSAAAVPRIYARETVRPETWHVLIADSSDGSRQELADLLLTGDYIPLSSTAAMAPGEAPEGIEDLFIVQSGALSVPRWLRERCGPDALNEGYKQLLTRLRAVQESIPASGVGDPFQAAVLRVLIVHSWRRIVLRHPDLPSEFLPEAWKGPACRKVVFQILDRLPRPSIKALESALTG